jgi:hypothetical protein
VPAYGLLKGRELTLGRPGFQLYVVVRRDDERRGVSAVLQLDRVNHLGVAAVEAFRDAQYGRGDAHRVPYR